MKKNKRLIACYIAIAMLCCGCSVSSPDLLEPEAVTVLSLAEQELSNSAGFADVPANAWYAEAAEWCREHNILTGTTFDAETAMTRAMVADALYRAEGSPAVEDSARFSDIPAGSSYANAASWASANGIMSGYGGGRFGGENPVTREQMAAILWRYAGGPAAPTGEDFADEADIAAFAKTAVDWARAHEVVNGKGGNLFDPKGSLTRAQTAVILHRYLTNNSTAFVNINKEEGTTMNRQIKLTVAGQECIATLYDNPSADDLYNALPLELTFEDFNRTEKISYPPKALTTEGMPDTFDPDVGDLCLYAPWGNLCIFYRDFRESTSLIPLGHIESGIDAIGSMTENFTVTMEAVK